MKQAIHNLSGVRATVLAQLVPRVKQIVAEKIQDKKLPPTEEDFVVGIAKATIGQELEEMPDRVVEKIDPEKIGL
jgi:hypothetical protein